MPFLSQLLSLYHRRTKATMDNVFKFKKKGSMVVWLCSSTTLWDLAKVNGSSTPGLNKHLSFIFTFILAF